MSWASRRQTKYLLGLLFFCGLIIFILLLPQIIKKPTCSDGRKNGGEAGVDCGGKCESMCKDTTSEPVTIWKRAFHVSNNMYNLVALVENQNKSGALRSVNYEFRIYNTKNLLIGRRQGSTFLPPNQQFVIFEPRFDAGEDEIRSVNFEFLPPINWVKKDPSIQTLPIKITNILYGEDKNSPLLTAKISNESLYDLPEFDVIAVLYDKDHNALNASRTHKDGLTSNSNSLLLFTWPLPFGQDPVTQDIFVQINPFIFSK